MKILQIATNYPINKLYKNLFSAISEHQISQDIYIPLKSFENIDINNFTTSNTELFYSNILKLYDRFFYRNKIKKQAVDIEKKLNISEIDLIHAHTWYSDGGTAYLLNKRYSKPYIVSIRNTDINYFYKYRVFERNLGVNILKNANQIIFLSHAYKNQTINMLPQKYKELLLSKSFVIPNGIPQEWLVENEKLPKHEKTTIKLLFMGTLNANKNLKNVLYAMKSMSTKVEIKIIGSGPLEEELKELALKLNVNAEFLGYKNNIDEIKNIMNKSDIFVLASHTETFGISYIEAMSQGLPIIYTKNQGIDGYFDETCNFGEKVDSYNVDDIAEKIEYIEDNYNDYVNNGQTLVKHMDWNNISKIYIKQYKEINY